MIRKTISAHDGVIPRGYRISWVKAQTDEYVCYPIGLNWLMTKLYQWWLRSFRYTPSDLEIKEMKIYQSGHKDGSTGRDEKFKLFQEQLASYEKENVE